MIQVGLCAVWDDSRGLFTVIFARLMLLLVYLTSFAVVYSLLFIAVLYFGSRIIRRGSNLDLPVPGVEITKPAVDTTPGDFVPDERPVEAQQ